MKRNPNMGEKKEKSSLTNTTIKTTSIKTCKKHPFQSKNKKKQQPTKIYTLFSLTLASLKNPQNPLSKKLILNSSKKFISLLHPKSSSSEPNFSIILSLIPSLLHSLDEEIVCTAVRIVGSISLVSIDLNERVCLDVEILKGLVLNFLRNDERMIVKKAVCSVVLDLSITSLGCQKLLQVSCLNYIMRGFLQVQNSILTSIHVKVMKNDLSIFVGVENYQDEILLLFLKVIVTLTNICNHEQLQNIPRILKEEILSSMKDIWSNVHQQLLTSRISNISEEKFHYTSNLTVPNMAETIFRLSMNIPLTYSIPSKNYINQIFGPSLSNFKDFFLRNWESSPILVRNQSKDLESRALFNCFMHSLTCDEEVPDSLSSILRGLVSCPPIALNEIDILTFLNDVRNKIGSKMIYPQDIRVIRTNSHSKCQEHYFDENSTHKFFDISKCKKAFEEGYTIAIRGMEFRFNSISEITQELASLFGQPKVGANLYITPPNSQGLSCHYDDHCVFVWQLYGCKKWVVSSKAIVELPRLYKNFDVSEDLMVESKEFFLREGDVLYIPRGFAHKAETTNNIERNCEGRNSSIHLTLAIEVEPPFEWEGFTHIALHHWSNNIDPNTFSSKISKISLSISVNILHVSIRLISYNETIFRKACLVASNSFLSETKIWLDKNQRDTFDQIIGKINDSSNFNDSLSFLRTFIHRDDHDHDDDCFECLRWLEHLNRRESFIDDVCDFTLDGIRKILPFIYEHKDDVEATFDLVKSKFCEEVRFDYVKESFVSLNAKYKEARMQYMNGMLSLHC